MMSVCLYIHTYIHIYVYMYRYIYNIQIYMYVCTYIPAFPRAAVPNTRPPALARRPGRKRRLRWTTR